MLYDSRYGNYRTNRFDEIYESYEKFFEDYTFYKDNCSLDPKFENNDTIKKCYYLLSSRYGLDAIINLDIHKFKLKLFSLITIHGPTWEKKLIIQDKLRNLTEEELTSGTNIINSRGYNPSTIVDNGPNSIDGEIQTMNEQTKTKYRKNKIEGYADLMLMLKTDVTSEFLDRFKKLFNPFATPDEPLYFTNII